MQRLFAATALAVAGFATPALADTPRSLVDLPQASRSATSHTASSKEGASALGRHGGAHDQVLASFERMLNHQASRAVAVAVEREADPLRKAVLAVLWEQQPASYHLSTQVAAAPAAGR
jgi:hypothetical protein